MEGMALSNVKVELEVPSARIQAAAMDVFEQYKPIVEEALHEAREKLLFDKDFQKHVKLTIIDRIDQAMKDGIESAAKSVVNNAYNEHFKEIREAVESCIMDIIKPKNIK